MSQSSVLKERGRGTVELEHLEKPSKIPFRFCATLRFRSTAIAVLMRNAEHTPLL
jgi:hypothetical protein